MVRITPELLRKRSEHNDGVLSTLEEISLHQFKIRRLECIDVCCPKLQILLLQNNKIRRIENLRRLKELRYLNLAINRIAHVEGLDGLESLEKLDLTANYISDFREFRSLSGLPNLRELFIMGNACSKEQYCKEFIITVLPSLTHLDGMEISRSDRIQASRVVTEHRDVINVSKYDGTLPNWSADSDNSDYEDRDASVRIQRAAAETAQQEKEKREGTRPPRPGRGRDPKTGRVRQFNELGFKFWFSANATTQELTLHIQLPIHMPTDSVDIDIEPYSVLLSSKDTDKQMQVALDHEVYPDRGKAVRITSTGVLKLILPVTESDRIPETVVESLSRLQKHDVPANPALDVSSDKAKGLELKNIVHDIDDADIEDSVPSDLPDLM